MMEEGDPSVMTDVRGEIEARKLAARRDYIHRIMPRATMEAMIDDDFRRQFCARWSFHADEIMRRVEAMDRVLHCLSCMETESWGMVKATRLRIVYEEDILKNFPSVLHGYCHTCGNEEIVGMKYAPSEVMTVREALGRDTWDSPMGVWLRQMMMDRPDDMRALGELDRAVIHRDIVMDKRREIELAEIVRREHMRRMDMQNIMAPPARIPAGLSEILDKAQRENNTGLVKKIAEYMDKIR